jgi:hypothetical protein
MNNYVAWWSLSVFWRNVLFPPSAYKSDPEDGSTEIFQNISELQQST